MDADEQRFLRLDVVIERAAEQPHSLADIAHGSRRIATLGKERGGGLQDITMAIAHPAVLQCTCKRAFRRAHHFTAVSYRHCFSRRSSII
ncbi:hypothetical protein D3C87_1738110 [compost metagenome]